MATAKLWKNVAVAMDSARATALTISGISKANPAVVTYTGTDPTDGDIILIQCTGMQEMNYALVRADNVNAVGNTFECEGVNSTSWGTFSAGSCEVCTMGTSIGSMTNLTVSGGEYDQIDITTIHDYIKYSMPGMPNPISMTSDHLHDASDTAQLALRTASDSQTVKAFRFTFGTGGQILLFAGNVGFTHSPTGTAFDKVLSPMTLTTRGRLTWYAS